MIYDIKHDGHHKACLVAGGHLTDSNTESMYSGVVSLRGIRLVIFLAELNQLEIWGADVGNAYLEALTKEKVSPNSTVKGPIGPRTPTPGPILFLRTFLYCLIGQLRNNGTMFEVANAVRTW
jgi:hypothetical protein